VKNCKADDGSVLDLLDAGGAICKTKVACNAITTRKLKKLMWFI